MTQPYSAPKDENGLQTGLSQPFPHPKIYYVHPLLLRGMDDWQETFRHARALGFDTILSAPLFSRVPGASVFVTQSFDELDPALDLTGPADDRLREFVEAARAEGLQLMLDIVIDKVAVQEGSGDADRRPLDPRLSPIFAGSRQVNFDDGEERDRHLSDWRSRIARFSAAGIAGFRCLGLDAAPASFCAELIRSAGSARFFAWTPGMGFEARRALDSAGFAGSFSSFAWWDLQEPWFPEEYEVQRRLGPQIVFPEAPFARRVAHGTESREIVERKALRALHLASTLGPLMVPMGFEFGTPHSLDPMHGDGQGLRGLRQQGSFDLSAAVRATNAEASQAFAGGPMRLITKVGSTGSALLQSDREDLRVAERVRVVAFNRDLRRAATAPLNAVRELASAFLPLSPLGRDEGDSTSKFGVPDTGRLGPGALAVLTGSRAKPILLNPSISAVDAAASPRLAIERIDPAVDEGRFPVKRIVGDTVTVEADIFGDGHDPLSAALRWRTLDSATWQDVPMQLIGNDRWRGQFTLSRLGRHEFAVEAWRNPFAIFHYELSKKHEARLDLRLELQEGLNLLRQARAALGEASSGDVAGELDRLINRIEQSPENQKTQLLLDSQTFALMARADQRPFKLSSQPIPVDAERLEAGFASWYELFPRSQSGDPQRHGTFADVAKRLPAIRAMGFDVIYFPPIHPIGQTNRKGRNNSLKAGLGDPGSPYAIGSEQGGHDAIHPELGTFDDFRALVSSAKDHGLEIALDLAIQASPDHPWLKQHPGWFDWRPDGTIRYAENPPKKYEDIVNVDFYAKDAVPDLWQTLRDIVEMWVNEGVKLFRVDNPHTKPFPFWEWLIGDIRARHPEVVFLSEAFTKPKVMYRLAKIGFSQSYTYFTWRNLRWEIEQYMRELTTEAPKEFFRPHFFVNTHDINPDFLQNAPRSAYLIRAALAATLSGLWGIYNGFELCEGRPDAKRKEYADSEKYEIRAWDWDRPGNIIGEIAMLNRIRRDNPALHSHLGLTLLPSSNDQVMFFEKASPGRENVVLIAISLDPHNEQHSTVELPLWRWHLPDDGSLALEDLVTSRKFTWTGKWQSVGFNPHILPFSLYRVR
ncbi:alpha-1,4-glucan--maltose-1-phosphate maltosyltransferase [Allorhizobium taibaishanense]|uniref:Alpha-1,4-glucan:maltose-1-phosphate maltosyltransferase n=1 Tax=Allorhizobium taibaishanense TaxID=887144 RepID=A0A1Q9A7W6_9HYPH|nr:alpha-1,4-glucan--maltose-1-phosphate maltosyltransferase [Allorhizobium taibaishanense]MBB4008590.1 starch synthase (maltosyl-transferring) [Allorhizobium taibaishanense]OLP50653.1 alpha-amylase [Allorhizobium taibaishanense]